MANIISDETIEYVGILAKLELNEEEKEQAKKDMGAMLDYIDKLNELDTTGVEPMSHVFPVTNVFREDVVTNGDGSEATLSNAPSMKDSGFKREAAKQTKELLNLENPPTCIIYPDDTALIGGRNVIIEMGLRIPKDISVAGYDGTRMSQLLHPKLTTIKQDTEEIGREAAKRLIGSIEKPKTTLIERVVIEGILIPGQSVGKIPEQK